MSIRWLIPMLAGFVGLALARMAWRASLTIFVALAVDYLGMIGGTIPPVYLVNQFAAHFLLGAVLGAIVCTGRDRDEVRRLPWLACIALLLLTVSWFSSIEDFIALLWLFVMRLLVLPVAMYAAIVLAQRYGRGAKLR